MVNSPATKIHLSSEHFRPFYLQKRDSQPRARWFGDSPSIKFHPAPEQILGSAANRGHQEEQTLHTNPISVVDSPRCLKMHTYILKTERKRVLVAMRTACAELSKCSPTVWAAEQLVFPWALLNVSIHICAVLVLDPCLLFFALIAGKQVNRLVWGEVG